MMKRILIAFLLFTSHLYSQEDIIIWNVSYELSWGDFQGKTEPNNYGKAKTSYSIQIIPEEVQVDHQERIIGYEKMTVRAIFQKKLSWSMAKFDTIVLNHEQVHFDIAELYARKIRKQFLKNITDKKSKYNKYWSDYKQFWNECITFQQKFDSETNHGRNFEQNKIWRELVTNKLKEYNEYK